MEMISPRHKTISLRRQCDILCIPRSSLYYQPAAGKPVNVKMMHIMDQYLLRGMKITQANQVWFTDITYIPMARGFMYLTAFIDVYSRRIVGWGISNTMSKQWCLQVLKDAIEAHGAPEIINSDQGSQYTSFAWTNFLESQGIKISMDGKGRATDNVWIERFWKTIKHRYLYLNPFDNGMDLVEGVKYYIEYYNQKKHQSLSTSPDLKYHESLEKKVA